MIYLYTCILGVTILSSNDQVTLNATHGLNIISYEVSIHYENRLGSLSGNPS